jgi:N-methylhydantoinase A/oxoprolinase/acetone carboxylase beta subunit
VLEIGRANRPDIYNLYYTSRFHSFAFLRQEVTERLYKGEVLTPLNEEMRAVGGSWLMSASSIALCFLHSYANPGMKQAGPDYPRGRAAYPIRCRTKSPTNGASLSATATVFNSYVLPIARYLNNLQQNLTARKR